MAQVMLQIFMKSFAKQFFKGTCMYVLFSWKCIFYEKRWTWFTFFEIFPHERDVFSSSEGWKIDCEKKINGSESNESNGTSCVRKQKKLISVFKYVFLAPPLSNGCPPPSVHPKAKTPINTDLPWKLQQIKILYRKKEKDPSNVQWNVCNILSILCVG